MNGAMARLRRELSHEVLFDEGVEAARNACVAGASIVAAAIVAAAYSDSPLVGIPALRHCMQQLETIAPDIDAWCTVFQCSQHPETQETIFAPGFGLIGEQKAQFLVSVCRRILWRHPFRTDSRIRFYLEHQTQLTPSCGAINQVGVMSMFCVDQRLTLEDAERHFLSLRIECAIAEAQKTRKAGLSQFPFLSEQYQYEGLSPVKRNENTQDYLLQIGLE